MFIIYMSYIYILYYTIYLYYKSLMVSELLNYNVERMDNYSVQEKTTLDKSCHCIPFL